MNGLIEVGASYIYIYTLPVLIRVKRKEGKLIWETIRQDATVKRILDWEPGFLDLSHLKFKNLQSLKWC